MHDARAIANFLLDYGDSRGRRVTLLPLLKIIYFAHGWHLAKFSAPLIQNEFEAWEFGPVVRVVYDALKGSRREPIQKRALRVDPITGIKSLVRYNLTGLEQAFLGEIFDLYSQIEPMKLSEMTHLPGSPWYCVWHAPKGTATPGMVIKNNEIKSYFRTSKFNLSVS